jgi:hypothetical protein
LHNTADTQPVVEPVQQSERLEEDHTADKRTTTPKKEAAAAESVDPNSASDVEDDSPEPSKASERQSANVVHDEIVALRQEYQDHRKQAVDEFVANYDRAHMPRLNRTIARKRKDVMSSLQAMMDRLQDA